MARTSLSEDIYVGFGLWGKGRRGLFVIWDQNGLFALVGCDALGYYTGPCCHMGRINVEVIKNPSSN